MKVLCLFFLMPFAALAGTPNDGHPPPENPQEPPSWENVLKQNQTTEVDTNVFTKTEVANTNILKAEGGEGGDASSFAKAEGGDAYAKVGDTTASVGDVSATTGPVTATGGAGGEGGSGGEGGDGGSVGDINVSGGGVNINHPRQVASAYAPTVFPTAICEGGQSLGVQTTKWGVSWTRSDSRREACLFALAQQWMAMGAYRLACQALMATRSATYAHMDKEVCQSLTGPVPLGQPPAQSQPTVIVVPVTNGDPERIERIFKQLSEK